MKSLYYKEKELTVLDLFEKEYGLKISTLKVTCPNCNNSWGIKVDDYTKTVHIPEKKFICNRCGFNSELEKEK